ncbi:tail fiber assembly protein [Kosakonia sacchari]|uniref:tail fiber assembly protein n=1 Tax=Kosakonia sacchari TaxID=1158459 RepID=UPI003CC91973
MNVEYYAVSEAGWRAVSGPEDLLAGEVLHTGNPPVVPAADNSITKSTLMTIASNAIAPLQDAVELGIATDDETRRYNEWRKYRVLLSRMDIALESPKWPDVPSA